jgi:uncharacterized RDD family membrane protein YckC
MSDFSDNNRFTPPKAALADAPTHAGGLELAGRGRRLGAVMLDGVLGWVVLLASMFALHQNYFSAVSSMEDPGSMSAVFEVMFRSFGPGLVIVMAVQAWFLHSHGGTLGKKLLGMRIVRTDGSRAGFVRLFFVRAGIITVINMIPLLGGLVGLVDMVLIFRDSRQCLHDNIADTIVVTTASSVAAAHAAA